MAVNLIDSNDIKVIQSDNDIELQTDKTTLNSIINAKIKNSNTSSTTDTYSCDYIDSIKDTYSTSETLTNKVWIDGKPIYRKVLTFTTGSSAGDMGVPINESNIEMIVFTSAFTYRPSDGEERHLPNVYRNMSGIYTIAIYTTTRTEIQLTYGDNRTNMSGYIIVEYTKTTD